MRKTSRGPHKYTNELVTRLAVYRLRVRFPLKLLDRPSPLGNYDLLLRVHGGLNARPIANDFLRPTNGGLELVASLR